MFVDLLVTTYKRPNDIAFLLPNLEAQTYHQFQLQIFDGSPDDATEHVVQNYLAGPRAFDYPLHYHRTTAGMTRQRNIAVDATTGDLSIFLDDDVDLLPDYLSQVVQVFTDDADCTIAGLNGYDLNGSHRLGRRQKIFRAIGLLPASVGCARYLPSGHGTPHWEGGPFDGIRDCDLLIGHNMAWRTAILKELRFADFYEQYPGYVLYDDQDICLRARRTYRLVQSGSSRMRHRVSPDARPPGFHYGFQTVFNAYRNWRVHRPHPTRSDARAFWAWELLNIFFLSLSSARTPGLFAMVRGRLAAAKACREGVRDYNEWQLRHNDPVRS